MSDYDVKILSQINSFITVTFFISKIPNIMFYNTFTITVRLINLYVSISHNINQLTTTPFYNITIDINEDLRETSIEKYVFMYLR